MAQDGEAQGPLAGAFVLDVTHVMAGSSCGLLLALMGAEVVKVERAGGGDDLRRNQTLSGGAFRPPRRGQPRQTQPRPRPARPARRRRVASARGSRRRAGREPPARAPSRASASAPRRCARPAWSAVDPEGRPSFGTSLPETSGAAGRRPRTLEIATGSRSRRRRAQHRFRRGVPEHDPTVRRPQHGAAGAHRREQRAGVAGAGEVAGPEVGGGDGHGGPSSAGRAARCPTTQRPDEAASGGRAISTWSPGGGWFSGHSSLEFVTKWRSTILGSAISCSACARPATSRGTSTPSRSAASSSGLLAFSARSSCPASRGWRSPLWRSSCRGSCWRRVSALRAARCARRPCSRPRIGPAAHRGEGRRSAGGCALATVAVGLSAARLRMAAQPADAGRLARAGGAGSMAGCEQRASARAAPRTRAAGGAPG